MVDLAALNFTATSEEGAQVVLRHPLHNSILTNDKGKEMSITVIGRDAPSYQKVLNRMTNAKFDKATRTKRLLPSAEEALQEEIEILAQATKGWENLQLDGKLLEFTVANARDLYTNQPWIREQVLAFIDNRANFLKS